MNLRTATIKRIKRFGKKGSYLVEAAITLPIMLIAVICMSSIILMYACIENSNFIIANEMRKGACEAIIADTSIGTPFRIKKEIEKEHSLVKSVHITDYGYRVTRWDIDELMAVSMLLKMKQTNPIGLMSEAEHEISLGDGGGRVRISWRCGLYISQKRREVSQRRMQTSYGSLDIGSPHAGHEEEVQVLPALQERQGGGL